MASLVMDASSKLGKQARAIQGASSAWNDSVRQAQELNKIALDPSRDQDDKLRGILYTFLTRTDKPPFFDDGSTNRSKHSDAVGAVPSPSSSHTRAPIRMLDIDTRNLMTTYSLGREDRYCILSHSWKGNEIDLGYFGQAKQRVPEGGIKNDFQVVEEQCADDVERMAERLDDVLKSPHVSGRFDGVHDLLCRRFLAKKAEDGLAWARGMHNEAIAGYDSIKRENQTHIDLLQNLLKGDLRSERPVIRAKAEEQQNEMLKMTQEELGKAEQAISEAKAQLDAAEETYAAHEADLKFLEENREVFYAIEDILGSLQRRKSAVKIENTICRAKELFDTKGYSATGRRYVWLDTCCIDKSNSHELTESLALMGEWYANAEFCLVHLDTSRSDEEWLDEWDSWNRERHGSPPVCIPKLNKCLEPRPAWSQPKAVGGFDEILERSPEWATRGWTLQELILSKMTYYINHHWQLLHRPVDALGPFYYLCPLVNLYIGDENLLPEDQKHCGALKDINALESISGVKSSDEDKPESIKIQKAQMLIAILKSIGFSAPRNMDEGNARAHMARIVRGVSEQLASRQQGSRLSEPFEAICKLMGISPENNEKYAVDMLLRALVDETRELITDDRKYIAKFSKVEPLENWAQGTGSNNSSSHRVLMLASDRRCTVATDKAYSLMGILGVQFPAFSAEGLTKALSRVIDEVIITSNDVSVFNWAGEHQGSPIRGRSLYPASLDAFQLQKAYGNRRAERNAQLFELFEKDRLDLPEISKRINKLLGGAIDSVKYLRDGSPVLQWLQELGDFIKGAIFEELQPNLENLDKLLRFIENNSKRRDAGDADKARGDVDSEQVDGENNQREKNDENGSGSSLLPSWGWNAPKAKSGDNGQPNLLTKLAKGLGEREPGSGSQESPQEKLLRGLDEPMRAYIKELSNCPGPDPVKLPQALDEALKNNANPQPDTTKPEPPRKEKAENIATRMVCPNPISVTSSGIKGAFDVQRVVINMLQPQRLRAQVESATSPYEKVSGWCTISTGFAMTMVSFSCEKHILEQQMDLVDVINHTVLGGDSDLAASEPADAEEQTNGDVPEETQPPAESPTKTDQEEPKDEPNTSNSLNNYGNTHEEKKVSRMIDFVQETNLNAIAGEWVLARVSGTPGAKWFLCRLELGSGRDFYGRRIATDEFDFHEAVPEKGLFEHWQRYMMTKKDILCHSLSIHLDGKRSGKFAKDLEKKVMQGADKKNDEDEDEDSKLANVWNTIGLIGWEARRRFVETLAEHREDLEGLLGELALQRVPPRLQAAILDFNARKSLLPLMFHSGREIHMF
ncbi:Heterokaryon incompatibility protein HET [Aspergillus sp. HF37]|nr:Heterokaryon incompatibility protein HET [Aspergillus sp. HF37]